MGKVYIRKNTNGEIINENGFTAYMGFKELGFEIEFYTDVTKIEGNKPEDIVVGGIYDIRYILDKFGFVYPTLEYPSEIQSHLGRRIWTCTLGEIVNNPDNWNVFIKPVEGGKIFTGAVIRNIKDLRAVTGVPASTEVYCSEIVEFVSEWRVFVRYGQVVDAKHYKGKWGNPPDEKVVLNAIADYKSAPNGYVMDFGTTIDGKTFVVEVNEGYSVGAYGLNNINYAKVLSARWSELTNTTDECNF